MAACLIGRFRRTAFLALLLLRVREFQAQNRALGYVDNDNLRDADDWLRYDRAAAAANASTGPSSVVGSVGFI
jgi:hypothetical protein